jgi:uncharacterized protein YnzC (UPF0291/DUF896 family)
MEAAQARIDHLCVLSHQRALDRVRIVTDAGGDVARAKLDQFDRDNALYAHKSSPGSLEFVQV